MGNITSSTSCVPQSGPQSYDAGDITGGEPFWDPLSPCQSSDAPLLCETCREDDSELNDGQATSGRLPDRSAALRSNPVSPVPVSLGGFQGDLSKGTGGPRSTYLSTPDVLYRVDEQLDADSPCRRKVFKRGGEHVNADYPYRADAGHRHHRPENVCRAPPKEHAQAAVVGVESRDARPPSAVEVPVEVLTPSRASMKVQLLSPHWGTSAKQVPHDAQVGRQPSVQSFGGQQIHAEHHHSSQSFGGHQRYLQVRPCAQSFGGQHVHVRQDLRAHSFGDHQTWSSQPPSDQSFGGRHVVYPSLNRDAQQLPNTQGGIGAALRMGFQAAHATGTGPTLAAPTQASESHSGNDVTANGPALPHALPSRSAQPTLGMSQDALSRGLDNLAQARRPANAQDAEKKLEALERTLVKTASQYGSDHPMVAMTLVELAAVCGSLDGNTAKEHRLGNTPIESARFCLRRALVIFEKTYGPEHRSAVLVRQSLADLHKQVRF